MDWLIDLEYYYLYDCCLHVYIYLYKSLFDLNSYYLLEKLENNYKIKIKKLIAKKKNW